MSFWDHIKPAKRPPVATSISLSDDQLSLALSWDDGVSTRVLARTLRQHCPCAECVEEWSGRRTFEQEKIPTDTRILELAPVGNYALNFLFSDAHRVGIFHWTRLRELSESRPASAG